MIEENKQNNLEEFTEAIDESKLIEGKGKCVTINGKKIALFRYKGKIGAINHICPHQKGPLSDGEIKVDMLYVHGIHGNLIQ